MPYRSNSRDGPHHQNEGMYGIALGGLGLGWLGFRAHTATTELSLDFSGCHSSLCRERVEPVSASPPFSQKPWMTEEMNGFGGRGTATTKSFNCL